MVVWCIMVSLPFYPNKDQTVQVLFFFYFFLFFNFSSQLLSLFLQFILINYFIFHHVFKFFDRRSYKKNILTKYWKIYSTFFIIWCSKKWMEIRKWSRESDWTLPNIRFKVFMFQKWELFFELKRKKENSWWDLLLGMRSELDFFQLHNNFILSIYK